MPKETIWGNERNKMPIIKSVGLDLALIIGADPDPTTLREDNVSRPRSPRATLVNPRTTMVGNLIYIGGESH